ncbi:S41 family peptidase [Sphingomonas sp. KR1UV-12]|uniref:S41 family peptidase n=1 Tax=Sphingomonas aurea TaxID=3063994 RepID=A0ABT9EL42_9SPHN|nr:S41 family peptidase [Sphingomonas sp. KR1UV-12]MDP1027684.1 S41 family peptidase [Sphingomonas sp. KR1UV-12]
MNNRLVAAISAAALLAGCGGSDGGGGAGGSLTPGTSATPTPTASTGCSLLDRQNWAAAQLREWYLFPDTLPATLDPTGYSTVKDYVDALTATARSQRKDRYFTYVTSIAEENAFYDSGASAGFGVRLSYDTAANRVFVAEAFENAPALAAGIDRGTEILAIGTSSAALRTVADLMAMGGASAVTDALGPSTAGTTRVLRIADRAGTREVTVSKTDYSLSPISSRYGVQTLTDGGQQIGYLNLRTFISTADPALRTAFANFRAAGITQVIIDLRYNGGGLVNTAELMGDLLGGNRSTSDVFSYTAFRPEKASNNKTRFFSPQSQSIAPTRIAFIGTGGTASASELLINAFTPYLHTSAALIGSNTYGKPVGQIALDKSACDDRLRVIAFATQNAARQGDYYDGLATRVEASCRASDDTTYPLGDPREASTRAALDFLAGRTCTPIASTDATAQSARSTGRRELLTPERPTTAQREVPGLF